MSTISKTTQNKARRNGLFLYEDTRTDRAGNQFTSIEISEYCAETGEVADEFLAAYRVNRDGSFSYLDSCGWFDNDCPAHLENEQALRDLLPEFARFYA